MTNRSPFQATTNGFFQTALARGKKASSSPSLQPDAEQPNPTSRSPPACTASRDPTPPYPSDRSEPRQANSRTPSWIHICLVNLLQNRLRLAMRRKIRFNLKGSPLHFLSPKPVSLFQFILLLQPLSAPALA